MAVHCPGENVTHRDASNYECRQWLRPGTFDCLFGLKALTVKASTGGMSTRLVHGVSDYTVNQVAFEMRC
jgi:hypothetical protein